MNEVIKLMVYTSDSINGELIGEFEENEKTEAISFALQNGGHFIEKMWWKTSQGYHNNEPADGYHIMWLG